MEKKRYAQVGTGGRARMFYEAIATRYQDSSALVAFCDMSQVRMDFSNKILVEKCNHSPVPTYKHTEFDRMIDEQKPDVIIVTTVDRTHDQYIIRAMEKGCDVICEKPITTDNEKGQAILDAQKRYGRSIRVTFNYRYAPHHSKVRELIASGVIGEVYSVHFEWLLNTEHGADYYRRWHRNKVNSGGLLVHKSTHHFDLVNWWIDSEPVTVFAMGDLKFYGKANAEKRGITQFYSRARGSKIAAKDPFALHVKEDDENLMGLYYNAESEDGYYRDQSVFGDCISIEDNMGVMVRYKNNVVMTYSLCAHCPWEGYRVVFNGTKGRLEFNVVESPFCEAEGEDFNHFGMSEMKGDRAKLVPEILFQPHWGKPQVIEYSTDTLAGHGGGDDRLLRHLFVGVDDDPLGLAADYVDGAKSILTGIGANISMKTGEPVKVQELIHW